ncbi:MAG: hypothetical protein ABSF13_09430 [Smithella sp.]
MTLRFVYKKEPALVLDNVSGKIAREIKWGVFLWNYDLPERNDPLPIPVATFDWLRPHDHSGPLDLFGLPNVPTFVKAGDRLFGTASVICPECSRGRTFFIYIKLGEGGWYVEHLTEKSGGMIVPKDFTKEGRMRFYEEILALPVQSRIPILDLF